MRRMAAWLAVALVAGLGACSWWGDNEFLPKAAPAKPSKLAMEVAAHEGGAQAQYDYAQHFCCTADGFFNIVDASKWLCKAAQKDYVPAQFELAALYDGKPVMRGRQVWRPETARIYTPHNIQLAYAWYSLAAQNGHIPAQKRLNRLALEIPLDGLERAKVLMRHLSEIPCQITHQPAILNPPEQSS